MQHNGWLIEGKTAISLGTFKPKLHLFDLLWICCTTSCTTNPRQMDRLQQIEAMEFGFDLLWTCCSVAANQRADVELLNFRKQRINKLFWWHTYIVTKFHII